VCVVFLLIIIACIKIYFTFHFHSGSPIMLAVDLFYILFLCSNPLKKLEIEIETKHKQFVINSRRRGGAAGGWS
jgi:hypothetical protein